ncbi:MAG TPA: hypothetical protein VMV05_04870 [bacterium]|nr:hypothetical protein [bacterium]
MRRSPFLKGIVLLTLLSWALFPLACGNNNSLVSPGGPAPTNTVAATSTPTNSPFFTYTQTATSSATVTPTNSLTATPTIAFNWIDAYWFDFPAQPSSNYIDFALQVNGAPSTTVGVTVTGGGVTLGIPFTASPVTLDGFACSNYYLQGVTFTAGVSYVFSTTAGGQTASVTLVAPGWFNSLTETASPYNGAVTYVSWGGAYSGGWVALQETAPVTGTNHEIDFYSPSSVTSVSMPTGVPATVMGYNAPAPSTYLLQLMLRSYALAPGGYSDAVIENSVYQSVTLH